MERVRHAVAWMGGPSDELLRWYLRGCVVHAAGVLLLIVLARLPWAPGPFARYARLPPVYFMVFTTAAGGLNALLFRSQLRMCKPPRSVAMLMLTYCGGIAAAMILSATCLYCTEALQFGGFELPGFFRTWSLAMRRPKGLAALAASPLLWPWLWSLSLTFLRPSARVLAPRERRTAGRPSPRERLLLVGVLVGAALAVHLRSVLFPPPVDPWKTGPYAEGAAVVETERLPRMLVIGDSVSRGYTEALRQVLAGRVYVWRLPENVGSTSYALGQADRWLNHKHWDVIHFNFGFHDLMMIQGINITPIDEYKKNLGAFIERLQKTDAVLLYGLTTPAPEYIQHPRWDREGWPEAVDRYNAAAREVMDAYGVETIDLHAVIMQDYDAYKIPQSIHFEPPGYLAIANAIAPRVLAALELKDAQPAIVQTSDIP